MKEREKTKDEISIELQSLRESVRQLKESLEEAQGRYRALTDTSLQGLVIVQGIPLRVVYASRPAAEMLGYSIEEVLSASPDQIQHRMFGDDRPAYLRNYQGRLEGGAVPPRYEARVMRKDGEFQRLLSSTLLSASGSRKRFGKAKASTGGYSKTFRMSSIKRTEMVTS
jgi:PAS domain S-box-containing protein